MNRLVATSLLCGAVLLSGAAAAAPNLVANPGFETGDFTGWAVTGNVGSDIGVDQYAVDVNSGNYGAYLGNANVSSLAQTIATVPGASYEVSFYLDVYQSTAYNGYFTASFAGHAVANLIEPGETDAFVQYTGLVTATGTHTTLAFSESNPGGWFGLDDISVVQQTSPVPEPGAVAMWLAALGVLRPLARWRARKVESAQGR